MLAKLFLRRLLQAVPLLLGVIVLNFVLINSVPGDFLDVMTAESQITDAEMIERLRTTYGLDAPKHVQLMKYIVSVAKLDLGFSYRHNMPVIDVIMAHMFPTVLLMLTSIGIAVLVGVAAGIVASIKVNTWWDTLISVLAIFFFAAPSFWLGIMMIILFSVQLGWFPVGGMTTVGMSFTFWQSVLDIAHHLVLPSITLGLFYAATYARVMRTSMLEVFRMDFVRTARAKGLGKGEVILRHVFRNALLPIVTLLGLQLGTVLGGSIVIEAVFNWPGIGSLLFDSVMSRNYPVILGALVLTSLIVIVSNALVDVIYGWLDPRIQTK